MAKIDALFKHLRDKEGSDLFIIVGEPPKMRVHGSIVTVEGAPNLTIEMVKVLLMEILSDEQREVYMKDKDLDFAHALEGIARFRCNYFYQNEGPAACFRIIPEKIKPLTELNLPPVIGTFADYARGLILVTGPTGSGKSTTLAGIINEINERYAKHIVTIEDPLEFVHAPKKSLITHREVGTHCDSFDSALRASVREDPDVILVGEMRDLETIRLALTAAEMGFLVLGTLHTNSAAKTVDRIVDVFPAAQQPAVRTMLAGSLVAICSQLLVKGVGGKSRFCANEIMLSSAGLGNAIREGNMNMIKTHIQSGGSQGMILMDASLEKLVQSGKADPEDVYMKATDKQRFQRYMQGQVPSGMH
ncbi:MAG: type IV pilus twitching motility protein PilT [Candidatus Obscuribacterales bacterium]|nr:type IV pilus twitching motility protein PilT [Candidatus Obscuribacterales bacterium]